MNNSIQIWGGNEKMKMIVKKLNSLKGVKVSDKINVLKLFHVEVNGEKI